MQKNRKKTANKYQVYEQKKKQIPFTISAKEYDKAIKKIVEKLKI